jgi:hypothetical protein
MEQTPEQLNNDAIDDLAYPGRVNDRAASSHLTSMCASLNFFAIDILSALWTSTLRSTSSIHAYSR